MRKVFGVSRIFKNVFKRKTLIKATFGKNVKFPIFFGIENHNEASSIIIGDNNEFGNDFHIRCFSKGVIKIGEYNWTSLRTQIVCANSVEIGNYCMLGRDVYISDTNEHPVDSVERLKCTIRFWDDGTVNRYEFVDNNPVRIGDNVWIGERSIILKGVTIGNNSVVAAGSVVTRSVPENCVVGGNPAKIIKNLG